MRLFIGGVVLGGYQLLSDTFWMGRVTPGSSWCEIEGVISWGAMLILATVLADWYYAGPGGRKMVLLGSFGSLVLGVGLSRWVDVSQYHVSASYVLIGLGASGILYWAFDVLTDRLGIRLPLLISWGKNPLLLYLLHYWIWVYAFLKPLSSSWHIQAPLWLIVLQASGFVGLLSVIAWVLDHRGWVLSL
jgi:hypothetical protein